jgi:hypothetical protein
MKKEKNRSLQPYLLRLLHKVCHYDFSPTNNSYSYMWFACHNLCAVGSCRVMINIFCAGVVFQVMDSFREIDAYSVTSMNQANSSTKPETVRDIRRRCAAEGADKWVGSLGSNGFRTLSTCVLHACRDTFSSVFRSSEHGNPGMSVIDVFVRQ